MNDVMLDQLFKQAFGLNRFVDHLNRQPVVPQAFPPYNIIVDDPKSPTSYTLEMAVAGFSKDDITVKVVKTTGVPQLVIHGEKPEEDTRHYVQRGLAAREFTREFNMSDDIVVDDVALVDGILTISMVVVKPKDAEKLLTIR